jgi:Transposase DDE domain
MDGQLFWKLYRRLLGIANLQRRCGEQFCDLVIVAVFLWGVIHDRPQGWGCHRANWNIEPPWGELPSESCLSRRLQTPAVKKLMDKLCDYLWGRFRRRMVKCVDGKALTVSFSSKDPTACIGPAAGGRLAKGYKLHVIVDGGGVLHRWAVSPLNHGESHVARKLVCHLTDPGYLLGDSNYDYNRLYTTAAGYGQQLVAPPKRRGKGLGHMIHSAYRLRGLDLLQQPLGRGLLAIRKSSVERFFGNLGWLAGGMSQLPGFVRTLRRVRRWVQGKLILQAVKMEESLELC